MKTINLLPEERKKILGIKNFNGFVFKLDFVVGSALVTFLVFMGAILFILNIYQQINEKEIARDEGENLNVVIKDMKKEIDQQYQRIKETLKQFDSRKPYFEYLKQVSKALPEKVYFKKIKINAENISIQGVADNREDLLVFESYLKENESFKDIKMPISNFTSQKNVSFEIEIDLTKK
jgi:Tfp pilus assembly protein PilN